MGNNMKRKLIKHKLILVAGNTGSGKTVLCDKLSNDTGIRYIEVNQLILGYPKRLIFESTGLGSRTAIAIDNFPDVFTIKCMLPIDEAVKRIEVSTKVFSKEENRLGKTQMEFYWLCKDRIDQLPCDIEYNFNTDSYNEILNRVNKYINE